MASNVPRTLISPVFSTSNSIDAPPLRFISERFLTLNGFVMLRLPSVLSESSVGVSLRYSPTKV